MLATSPSNPRKLLHWYTDHSSRGQLCLLGGLCFRLNIPGCLELSLVAEPGYSEAYYLHEYQYKLLTSVTGCQEDRRPSRVLLCRLLTQLYIRRAEGGQVTKRATSPIIASAESSIFVEGECRRCIAQHQQLRDIYLKKFSWEEMDVKLLGWAVGYKLNSTSSI